MLGIHFWFVNYVRVGDIQIRVPSQNWRSESEQAGGPGHSGVWVIRWRSVSEEAHLIETWAEDRKPDQAERMHPGRERP